MLRKLILGLLVLLFAFMAFMTFSGLGIIFVAELLGIPPSAYMCDDDRGCGPR